MMMVRDGSGRADAHNDESGDDDEEGAHRQLYLSNLVLGSGCLFAGACESRNYRIDKMPE